jgi:threonine/homoserine/homoserine lactone efflux protein
MLPTRHLLAYAGTAANHSAGRATPSSAAWQGFFVGVANPKTIVFFAAMLPQFVDQRRGSVAVLLLNLGAIGGRLLLTGQHDSP